MARTPLSPQDAAALKVYRQLQRALGDLVVGPLAPEMRQDQDHPKDDPRASRGMVAAVCAVMDRLQENHPAISARVPR